MVMKTPRPFCIQVDQQTLDDLRDRLERTRWPDPAPGGGWDQGTEMGYLRRLVEYWRDQFDWRAQECRLNALPQFHAKVDGLDLHFIHLRGSGPNPLPLLLTHGWPSSFVEFEKIIPLLIDPASHGGNADDSFDVVVPSLPGYGFSERPTNRGMTKVRIAELFAKLMTETLGYSCFCAHGGDIGAGVTSQLGLNHAPLLHGIHVMSVLPPWLGEGSAPLTPEEIRFQALAAKWDREEDAYGHLQRTFPQTLAYGLHDSPAGLASWIVEKFRSWSDCGGDVATRFSEDELLTNITLYWVTETFASSLRLYYDGAHYSLPADAGTAINVPTGIALTTEPVDLAPRAWAERSYHNIQHWTEFPRGGHFLATEEPALLAEDLRTFFRRFR